MITKEQFCKVQDHALLRHSCTKEEVKRWCSQADKYGFASVCVNPCEVAVCKELLKGSKVGVGTVIGYPFGVNTAKTKIFEGLTQLTMEPMNWILLLMSQDLKKETMTTYKTN